MILKSLHSPPKNPSSAVKYLYPSSVKHSTKPSTTSSSLMKQHAYNSTLSYSKERGKLSVSNLKAFQSISNKHSANNSKASAVANPVGVESNPKSEQSHSSAANSSVYASKRAKRISDLNNSADSIQNSSHAKATAQAKLSNNNENIGQIGSDIRNERRQNNLPAKNSNQSYKVSADLSHSGLDQKYIIKSTISSKQSEDKKVDKGEITEQNFASDSYSSSGSVPDEYGNQNRKRLNKQLKSNQIQNSNIAQEKKNQFDKIMIQTKGRNYNINGTGIMYNRENEDEEFDD